MNLNKEIEKSFSSLEKLFSENDLQKMVENGIANELHFSAGLWIRNNLLQEQSTLCQMFLEAGIDQRDTMSEIILNLFCENLREKQFKQSPPR